MKANKSKTEVAEASLSLATPWVGTLWSVLAGLSFCAVCMVLPLVGKAAKSVPHYQQNCTAFVAVLAVSLVLAVVATLSKMARRRVDQSPLPWASIFLLVAQALLLAAFFLGLLKL